MTPLTPFKLTPLGLVHTLVSLVCVAAAFAALYQDHGISRLPPSRPWVQSPDAPVLRAIYALLFVLFLVGVTLQVRG